MADDLRLHCFAESGNAYKAALALELAGLDWTPVHVDFFRGATRDPAFRAVNTMGEVPVLETPEGTITQSGAILDWIAETTGRFGWSDGAERRAVMRWLLFDSQKVSGQAGPLRFNLNFLPEAKRVPAVNDFISMRLQSALKVLEAVLSESDWLALGRPTIADLACCGYLYYPEPFGFDRTDFPAIDAWLTRIQQLDGWKHPYDLMERAFMPAA